MSIAIFEVNRNWQVRAENAYAAALKVAIEDGGAEERFAYSVVDMRSGEPEKVFLGREEKLEITLCHAVLLPDGRYARLRHGDVPHEGTETGWLIFPSIVGKISMMSMMEPFREKERAIRRAKKIGNMILARRAPVSR